MASLRRELRKDLEKAITAARVTAEVGARKAIEALAVPNGKPWPTMGEEQKRLRNKLRARGRQLGDLRNQRHGDQSIERLVQECAYEHWHRILFARFLAECDLLIEPESGVAISLEECKELAEDEKRKENAKTAEESAEADRINLWTLAGRYAQTMLPEIFRADDPVLQVQLAREDQIKLEQLLDGLTPDTFTASDSLGWCYQFWQAERKEEVNKAGNKIGADELPSVTQLFTEDYMVDFLLDNTLGAWRTGKVLAATPKLAENARSEEELRKAVALPGCLWEYLRFIKGNDGKWAPAAGTLDGWPKTAKELKCLDPCMGSGHFVVAMFERLVALRMSEEKLDEAGAVATVIRDNLFGLEIDPRCTQIGAFNLALAAWRRVGHCPLPPMNLACSGLAPNTREADWLAIAGDNEKLQNGMTKLYRLFKDAPVLGSLINPRAGEGDLLVAAFHELQPLLEKALGQEVKDDTAHEMAVTARGLAKAAEILADQFTLVATNVPYLGQGKQNDVLKDFCSSSHPKSKADLATVFVECCNDLCANGGTAALVTPQNWLFLHTYIKLRGSLLTTIAVNIVAELGSGAFQTPLYDFSFILLSFSKSAHSNPQDYVALSAATTRDISEKADSLHTSFIETLSIEECIRSSDKRILTRKLEGGNELSKYAQAFCGLQTGDNYRYALFFWEMRNLEKGWEFLQRTPSATTFYDGLEQILLWEDGRGSLTEQPGFRDRLSQNRQDMVDSVGVGFVVHRMGQLPASLLMGRHVDQNGAVLIPITRDLAAPIWAFLESPEYCQKVRRLDNKVGVTPFTLTKVPFDLAHWQKVAAEKYPHGLPKPFSSDPTQWLFNGHPKGSDQPLHVAVARLLGYQWPRQTGSSFPFCPSLSPDGLERLADEDGIVCLDALQGELSASERLRALLAAAYGSDWSPAKQGELLAQVEATSLDQWLREEFFEKHCELFHNRPFVWHIWDGLRNGFHALVNYHRLAAPNGEGPRTLEKLIYSYLGDWIRRQRDDQKNGVEGADTRVAAAERLKKQLELILHGEPPHDIFVRWKPLHEQPIGWEPDVNDGVRLNIRPFMTATPLNSRGRNASILRVTPKINVDKDRGKEPYREKDDFPWFWSWDQSANADFSGGQKFDGNRWNDLHFSPKFKQASRERNSLLKKAQKG